jgi:Protein of unknown function (DUF742)
MSTDSPGRGPERAARESSDADAVAEVFKRLSFDTGRRRRRHARTGRDRQHTGEIDRPVSEAASMPESARWPVSDTDRLRRETPADQEKDKLFQQKMRLPRQNESPVPENEWQRNEEPWAPSESQRPSDDLDAATYIRPYSWTGGRTRSKQQLELETLVSTSELCQATRLERLEHHSIADLCRHPRSVAEVGAVLGVPLGVAKVLLGDMADLGLITVHHTVTENGSSSHLMLMKRVLSGLRRL